MNIYQLLFRRNQHYLTIRSRDGRPAQRYKVPNHRFLKKAWSKQNPDEDLYITKYPEDGVISTIILDFDSEDNIEKAYEDCYKIYKFLQTKGTNSVIVSSGNKGYHLYIQIPATNFKLVGDIEVDDPNLLYDIFVQDFINNIHWQFETLDMVNHQAGLKGNIRLINSFHPKTKKPCKVVLGDWIEEDNEEYYYQALKYKNIMFKNAYRKYEEKQREKIQKRMDRIKKHQSKKFVDSDYNPLEESIVDVMHSCFNFDKEVQRKSGLWVTCPFHNDSNPSMVIVEDEGGSGYYYCKGCGAKGNVWTLIKEGYYNPPQMDNSCVKVGK